MHELRHLLHELRWWAAFLGCLFLFCGGAEAKVPIILLGTAVSYSPSFALSFFKDAACFCSLIFRMFISFH